MDTQIGPGPGDEPAAKPLLSATEARQGETSGHVRIVLAASLVLAGLAFLVLYALAS